MSFNLSAYQPHLQGGCARGLLPHRRPGIGREGAVQGSGERGWPARQPPTRQPAPTRRPTLFPLLAPALPAGRPPIYQSIFLDDATRAHWTVDSIDQARTHTVAGGPASRPWSVPSRAAGAAAAPPAIVPTLLCTRTPRAPPHPQQDRVLKTRMTRQFAHTWFHFAAWVPWVSRCGGGRGTRPLLTARAAQVGGRCCQLAPTRLPAHTPCTPPRRCAGCRGCGTAGTRAPTRCSTRTRSPP